MVRGGAGVICGSSLPGILSSCCSSITLTLLCSTLSNIDQHCLTMHNIARRCLTLSVTSTLPARPDVETIEAAAVFCPNIHSLVFLQLANNSERERERGGGLMLSWEQERKMSAIRLVQCQCILLRLVQCQWIPIPLVQCTLTVHI